MAFSYGVDVRVLPSRATCLRPDRDGNKYYPLPPKYPKLDEVEKAWWRVNACCIQDTPREFTEAYGFFFFTYLWPRESGFLEDRRTPAPFHYQMVHDVAAYHFNAFGAPRHACKTTVLLIIYMQLLLTRRGYRCGYLTSKQKKYRHGLNMIRKQMSNNLLLQNDFGIVVPKRGGESWNSDDLELAPPFNNKLTGMSLDSRERGWHGEFLGIDDPEKDPDTDEVIPEYVRKLDTRLRFVYMPMVEIVSEDLDNPEINSVGRSISYFGTVLGEGMVLNKILTAEPGGPYDAWNRWKFEQETMGYYLWPERWGSKSTKLQRRVLGDDAFDSEKQNRPGKSQKGNWVIDPVLDTYHLEEADGSFLTNPRESYSTVRWAVPDGAGGHTWRSLRAFEFVGAMNIGILIDTHKIQDEKQATAATSDFTVMHVIGNDANSALWSLDLRRGRYSTQEAIDTLVNLCFLWFPSFIAIEACGLYGRIADELFLHANQRMLSTIGWVPFPMKLGPFNKFTESKALRIGRVDWRFRAHKIKFPYWRRYDDPYDQCWHEVENFTSDLSRLKYDDVVDTIGLTPYCFRGPGGRPITTSEWEGRTVEQLIEAGVFVSDKGVHLIDMIPTIGELSEKALCQLEKYYGPEGQREFKSTQVKRVRAIVV